MVSAQPSRSVFPNKRMRYIACMYLFNLAIALVYLLLLPRIRALIGLGLIVTFAVVYLMTLAAPRRGKTVALALEIALIVIMIAVLNPGYIWLIFYPAAGAAYVFERRRQVFTTLAVLVGSMLTECLWLSHLHPFAISDWGMIGAAFMGAIAATWGTMWQSQTIRSREALREANFQIERLTKVAERDRISQDLHDVMGHELSMITLKAQLVHRLIDRDPQQAKAEIRDIEAAARKALTRVREYIADIRQPKLAEEWLDAMKLLTAAGIACEAEASFHEDQAFLSTSCEQVLAMCIREAVTNIVRHSRANKVYLKCMATSTSVDLIVADNGIGVPRGLSEGAGRGNGVNGIRARLSTVAGNIYFWSNGEPLDRVNPALPVPLPYWNQGTVAYMTVPRLSTAVREEVPS